MGKTSRPWRYNVPGNIGWATMETPGYLTLLWLVYALPKQEGIEKLPWPNIAMAGMFVRQPSIETSAPAKCPPDHSLHLPIGDPRLSLPQHIAHQPFAVARRGILQHREWLEHRGMVRRLWSQGTRRMAGTVERCPS